MKDINFKNRGFSLVELIIAITIFIIIATLLTLFFVNYYKTYRFQQAGIKLSNFASVGANALQENVRQADKIITTHSFSGVNYTTNSTNLILELPSVDSAGNIINATYDYVLFYISGNSLYKLVQANNSSVRTSGLKKINDNVLNINFVYNNSNLSIANKIDVNMAMQTIVGSQTISYNIVQEIYLRNIQ